MKLPFLRGKVRPLVVCAVLCLVAAGFASTARSASTSPAYVELLKAGRWLPALDSVTALAKREPAMSQETGRVLSLLGEHREALATFERMFSAWDPPPLPATSRIDSTRSVDAIAEIVARARDHRIVILNEAHHDASHRVFALQVARALRPLGFRYLACEACEGFPRRDLGVYTGEPFFGSFVRDALALGYEPVAYEAPDVPSTRDFVTDFTRRDSLQALGLMRGILEHDPGARVFIYCGYDHAFERPAPEDSSRQVIAMAEWLARLSGQDPLTIDQTVGAAASDSARATLAWRYARAHGRLAAAPTVLLFPSGQAYAGGRFRGRVDLQVFQPERAALEDRPGWMSVSGERIAVKVPSRLRPSHGRWIVEAFRESEPEDAVPLDRVIVPAGAASGTLFLPPGRYRLVAQDESGRTAGRMPYRVVR